MRIAALAVGAVAFIVVSMQVLAAYRIARERENWEDSWLRVSSAS